MPFYASGIMHSPNERSYSVTEVPPYVHPNWLEPAFSKIIERRHKSPNQMFHDRLESIMKARSTTYRDIADYSGLTRVRARQIIDNRIEPTPWESEQILIALGVNV